MDFKLTGERASQGVQECKDKLDCWVFSPHSGGWGTDNGDGVSTKNALTD